MRDGFLLVDKPADWTSHDVVAKVRNVVGIRKAGHAGTLDPMATGLLVIGLGRATRLLRFVQDLPKEYVASVRFGVATTSGDADGEVIAEAPVEIDARRLDDVLASFVGTVDQIPPQVSAIKRGGKRLHELARAGIEIELEPRAVEVYAIELSSFEPPDATITVRCGKGTYIRVLADDIARALGTRAHLTALRRTASGSLGVDEAVTIPELEAAADQEAVVLSAAEGLRDLAAVEVPPDQASSVRHGAPVVGIAQPPGPVRLLDHGDLIGVYRSDGGNLVPEVVVVT